MKGSPMCQVLAVTGHRPSKLGGYSDAILTRLTALATAQLLDLKPIRIITGMAQGWDQAVAVACIDLGIPFTAAIPCTSQDAPWPFEARASYVSILDNPLCTVHQCSNLPYDQDRTCMLRRNCWMVNNSTQLLALWDGTPGGTAHCVGVAQRAGRKIRNCWSNWVKYTTPPVDPNESAELEADMIAKENIEKPPF